MKKWLLKMIMPDADTIASVAAKAAADFVNSSNKQEVIAKFIEKTQKLENAQMMVTKWLVDGKFDEEEVKELKELLKPAAEALCKRVMEGL